MIARLAKPHDPMPTIELFTTPSHADAGHRVTAPGGYESWRFDVESGALRLRIEFHIGEPMSRAYARRFARYIANPTRTAPAVPAKYPAVSIEIFENDRLEAREIDRPAEFFCADDLPHVRIGKSAFQAAPDGAITLSLATATLTAALTFRPIAHASHRVDLSPHHVWLLHDPQHAVEGEIRWRGRNDGPRASKIDGRGYHDHHVGTRPLSEIAPSVFDGRIFLEQGVRAFFQSGPGRLRTVDFKCGQFTDGEESLAASGSDRTGWELAYPLDLPGARVIDSTFCAATILYDVDVKSARTAFCRVRAPRRVRWAINC